MPEKLYPQRQRCKACGRKLDATVLDGLYCSYPCAQLPTPFAKVEDAPRQCRLERDGQWQWKQRYRAEVEVPERLRRDPATNVYRCGHCHFLHVGHDRALGTETARLVRDARALGSVLERVREERGQSRKDVAARLHTRPIRIKEIEEGNPAMDVGVLFRLLAHHRMKVNLLF